MPRNKSKAPQKKAKSNQRKREYYTVPAKAHTSNKVSKVAPVDKDEKRPGVFGQMAATAGGVAVGTTIGHFVGNILTNIIGLASKKTTDSNNDVQRYEEPRRSCSKEIQQFINCAATEKDITLCQGFNEAIRECKQKHNLN
ncbi:coiled-coil-helix-coiled-coil-helix domain-containing protein 10, mitochondrial-like [Diabrotica virgifera virgifera]|uniref:Coiled-coil-helix-coiled-coil-helix domain-containing protein 2 n=1 Tax=Diabrotica virgifera virgifera TaxID=50390 RepID=A0ABM5JWS3_DIAVI|nr:coiled-coil-helix-coiled-coil-helix domain-containing protein 10, mitochondrial-like [Diabrotica virgifera virgifera]